MSLYRLVAAAWSIVLLALLPPPTTFDDYSSFLSTSSVSASRAFPFSFILESYFLSKAVGGVMLQAGAFRLEPKSSYIEDMTPPPDKPELNGIAQDRSGQRVVAAVWNAGIYISNNFGFSWYQTTAPTAKVMTALRIPLRL